MTPDAIQIIKTEPVKSWVTRQELEDAIQVTKTDDDGYPLEARVPDVYDAIVKAIREYKGSQPDSLLFRIDAEGNRRLVTADEMVWVDELRKKKFLHYT